MGHMVIEQPLTLVETSVTVDWYDQETGAATSLTEWKNLSGTVSVGDLVKVSYETNGTTPRFPAEVYKAAVDDATEYPPSDPTKWVLLGAVNQHKLFDGRNNSRTVADSENNLEFKIRPLGRIKFVYFVGLRNVRKIEFLIIYTRMGRAYSYSYSSDLLISYTPTGWYSWLYNIGGIDSSYRRSAGFYVVPPGETVPPYRPELRITLYSTDEPAECGQVIAGTGFWLGDTQWGAEPELKDYSTYEADEWGNKTFVPRQTIRNVRGTLWVPTNDYDRVYQIFESRMNSLALYDFNNGDDISSPEVLDALRVYGKLTSMSGGLAYNVTPVNLQIEGYN